MALRPWPRPTSSAVPGFLWRTDSTRNWFGFREKTSPASPRYIGLYWSACAYTAAHMTGSSIVSLTLRSLTQLPRGSVAVLFVPGEGVTDPDGMDGAIAGSPLPK